mgnify:CR=1 FL=1
MLYFSKLRIVFITIFSLLFVLIASSNLFKFDDSFFDKKINLGLDLQGGSYLLLEIDNEPVIEQKLQNLTTTIRNFFKNKDIRINNIKIDKQNIFFNVSDENKQQVIEIFEDENILLRYWDESSGDEMGLIINIETKKVVDKIQQPDFYSEDRNRINVYGEKLIDPWDTSDYSSRVIGVYYTNRMENIEVFKSKAPTNYYFESLHWSPNGDYKYCCNSHYLGV